MISRSSKRTPAAGFTLIEITVVVVLVGILSAMIIPEMRGTYEDALLRSTSRQLMDAFQLVYSRAVSFNQPHRLSLDPNTHRYVVERRVWNDGREDFIPLRDVPGCEGKLDRRISIQMRAASESFDGPAAGTPSSEANQLRTADLESSTTVSASPITDQPASSAESISFYADGTAEAGEVLLQDRQGFKLLLRVSPITAQVRIVEPGAR